MDAVPIEAIEQHKENILRLPEGRSAAALVRTFGTDKSTIATERERFEQQLQKSDELDDPIEPYLEYIKWINESFPQGQTSESGLVQMLEKCTSQFRDALYYKDDPRYLRVWLQYARFSDAPKELFIYLARKEIGRNLALYYEEYASYLEHIGNKTQAHQVYDAGIQINARPVERLKRKYIEFQQRCPLEPASSSNGRISPALPVVRTALTTKSFVSQDLLTDAQSEYITTARPPKLEIFKDFSGQHDGNPLPKAGGWESIGSLAHRKKENAIASQPWAGQKMPIDGTSQVKALNVFRDPGLNENKIAVALEFLHDEDGEEYCLEEVLARVRGILDKPFPRIDLQEEDLKDNPLPASPTMTFHTRAATNEVYEMFSQPLKANIEDMAEDEDEDADDDVDVESGETNNQKDKNADVFTPRAPRNLDGKRVPLLTPIAEATCEYSKTTIQMYANPADHQVRKQFEPLINDVLRDIPYYIRFHNPDGIHAKSLQKKYTSNRDSVPDHILQFTAEDRFRVKRMLGEGGYGCVYLAEEPGHELVALKIEETEVPWEYYILFRTHQRLAETRESASIISPRELYKYDSEQCMVLEYMSQGTMLDLVNMVNSTNHDQGLDERLVLFFTIELLRVTEALHTNNIIHGDLKADNVMVRVSEKSHDWDPQYRADGSGRWQEKGLLLLDFGRAIDMTLFGSTAKFVSDWQTDEEDCIEMCLKQPWSFETDYHGIASVVHLMLFGKRIKTVFDPVTRISKLTTPFKRYWQKDLWSHLFDFLLNSASYAGQRKLILPMLDESRNIRTELEQFLESNCGNLKSLLAEIEYEIKRRK